MKDHKFSLINAHGFGWSGIDGSSITSKDDFELASASLVRVKGRHGRARDVKSALIYFVIEGGGTFYIGEHAVSVIQYDVIIIPKETVYDFEGEMDLFLVMTPAYDPEANTILE